MESVQKKQKNSKALGYDNVMATPHVEKVVVSVGVGSKNDKNKIEVVRDRLAKITGQKPSARPAKKSMAAFKSRQGDIIGYQVTLRGARMFDFLDRLFNVALPRTRDFRGVKRGAVDAMGNLTIGIRENTIFPETSDEELRDVFGLAVTIVTTAHDKASAIAFLEHIGVPFEKGSKER